MEFMKTALLLFFAGFMTGCDLSDKSILWEVETVNYGRDMPFEPPQLNGNFKVGSQAFHWIDESRAEPHTSSSEDKRELLVRLFYPAENTDQAEKYPVFDFRRWPFWENAGNLVTDHRLRKSNYNNALWPVFVNAPLSDSLGFFPLVVFSHGYGFSPEEHLILAADLASRGFIVASINHPFGSSRAIFDDGRIIYGQDLPRDNLGQDLGLWSEDQIFVINQLEELNESPASFLYAKIDFSKVATSGHSYGGAAAYHSAVKDTRIKAAIDIDGTIFNSQDTSISVPFMLMQSGPGDSYEIFEQVANEGYGVAFKSTIHHHSFADYVLFWRWDFPDLMLFGSLDSELALKSSVDIVEQFLNKYFNGAEAPLLDDENQVLAYTRVTFFEQGISVN